MKTECSIYWNQEMERERQTKAGAKNRVRKLRQLDNIFFIVTWKPTEEKALCVFLNKNIKKLKGKAQTEKKIYDTRHECTIDMRYHSPYTRTAKIRNSESTKCQKWRGATGTLTHHWEGTEEQTFWKTVSQFLIKLTRNLPYVSAVLLLGIYPRQMKTYDCAIECDSVMKTKKDLWKKSVTGESILCASVHVKLQWRQNYSTYANGNRLEVARLGGCGCLSGIRQKGTS